MSWRWSETACFFFLAGVPMLWAQEALVEGNPKSPVRVIVYEDLQCSDCADFRVMMDKLLLPRYRDKVAFEHRDFPLARHAWARPAAIAARFFEHVRPELGLRWRRHILSTIRATTVDNFREKLAAFADANGVDAGKATAALEDARLAGLVEKDFQEGVARGVARTPTVLVDGVPFIERFAFEDISRAIDAALAASTP